MSILEKLSPGRMMLMDNAQPQIKNQNIFSFKLNVDACSKRTNEMYKRADARESSRCRLSIHSTGMLLIKEGRLPLIRPIKRHTERCGN